MRLRDRLIGVAGVTESTAEVAIEESGREMSGKLWPWNGISIF